MQVTAEQLWSKVGRQAVEIDVLQQELAIAQQRIAELEAAQQAPGAGSDPVSAERWAEAKAALVADRAAQANGTAGVNPPADKAPHWKGVNWPSPTVGPPCTAGVLPGDGD